MLCGVIFWRGMIGRIVSYEFLCTGYERRLAGGKITPALPAADVTDTFVGRKYDLTEPERRYYT
jgi:hypothetical protein